MFFTNSLHVKLAWIPPGKAWLGGGGGNPGTQEVTMAEGFYLGVCPVTQGQWQALVGSNPSYFSPTGPGRTELHRQQAANRFPVEMVTWNEAQEFCRRLSKKEGKTYRLPTEAEWEYACRAGTTSAYHSGDTLEDLERVGWCSFNGTMESARHSLPVALKQSALSMP